MDALTHYNQARQALAKAASVDEAKDIRDKALALEVYAKQAGEAREMERQIVEIRLRAERRIGELLSGMRTGRRKKGSHDATLSDLGITKTQSSRWQMVATLPEDDFERYVSTARELTTAGVLKLAKAAAREAARAEASGARSGGGVLTGPAARLWEHLENDSVDMFFTDPPYDSGGLACFSDLAELAEAKLKPGGLCLTYCGKLFIPEIIGRMARLEWWWMFSIRTGGGSLAHARGIKEAWKPLLAFAKPPLPKGGYLTDQLQGGGREKGLHDWQQSQDEVEYLIERLTVVGDLVVDPYCGSGTIPAACKATGRRWLACEIDGEMARVARGRIAA